MVNGYFNAYISYNALRKYHDHEVGGGKGGRKSKGGNKKNKEIIILKIKDVFQ